VISTIFISDMNRTLLVEEGDDEADNRQDKKKREKEKFPDTAGIHRVSSKFQQRAVCTSLAIQWVGHLANQKAFTKDS